MSEIKRKTCVYLVGDISAAGTIHLEVFENTIHNDKEEGVQISFRFIGHLKESDALNLIKDALKNSDINWFGENSGSWRVDSVKLSEEILSIKQFDWMHGTVTPIIIIDHDSNTSGDKENTIVRFKIIQREMVLGKKFHRLVNELVNQKKEELFRQQSEKKDEILQAAASKGAPIPPGYVWGKLDDLQVDEIRQRGDIVWDALKQTLEAFDPTYNSELASELHSLTDSFLPVSLCEPKNYLESVGWKRPFAEEVKRQLRITFECTRNSALSALKTKIDLYAAKKRSNSSRENRSALKAHSLPHIDTRGNEKDVYNCLWILETLYDDERGEAIANHGTGFMLENVGLVTCAHVVADKDKIYKKTKAFRHDQLHEKYVINVTQFSEDLDLAVVELLSNDKSKIEITECLSLATDDVKLKDPVSLFGFPAYKIGQTPYVVEAKVASKFGAKSIQKFEIDTQIREGNSGGPVLNSRFEVVGIAAEGARKDSGNNAVISVNELDRLLKKLI